MDKVRENRLRRWAHRLDYVICRSRAKHLHSNDFGLYQVCNDRNEVVYGANYDLELDDVEATI